MITCTYPTSTLKHVIIPQNDIQPKAANTANKRRPEGSFINDDRPVPKIRKLSMSKTLRTVPNEEYKRSLEISGETVDTNQTQHVYTELSNAPQQQSSNKDALSTLKEMPSNFPDFVTLGFTDKNGKLL